MRQPVEGEWYEANDDKWYCWPDPTPYDGPPSVATPPVAAPTATATVGASLSTPARWLLLAGVSGVLIGCFLPWVRVGDVEIAGTGTNDGKIFLVVAALALLLGIVVSRQPGRGGLLPSVITLLVLLAAGSLYEIVDINAALKEQFGFVAGEQVGKVGGGPYAMFVGALIALGGAVKGLLESRA